MKASQIIPALWQWFFGGAPPPAWLVYAQPGDGPTKASLAASRARAWLRAALAVPDALLLEDGSGSILLEDGSELLGERTLVTDVVSAPTFAALAPSGTRASLVASRTSAAIVSPPLTPDMRGGFWLDDGTGHLVLEDGSGRIT